jgi:hypothetical protein
VVVRRYRVLLTALVVAGAACVYLNRLHPRQRLPDHPYFGSSGRWIVAHRGGAALAPENTMEAFHRAHMLGADVLEMDVRVSADGIFVLMHDPTVERTTNGKGRVAEMRLADLRALDAGFRFEDDSGGFPFRGPGLTVPPFEDVLLDLPEPRLNVGMKDFTPAGPPGARRQASAPPEGRPHLLEIGPAHREHAVHRGLELDLPVGLARTTPDLENVTHVHRVVAVHANEAEGREERDQLAQGPYIAHTSRRAQADQGRFAGGLEEVHVKGIDRAASIPREVQQQSVMGQLHAPFLPRAAAEGKRTVVFGR